MQRIGICFPTCHRKKLSATETVILLINYFFFPKLFETTDFLSCSDPEEKNIKSEKWYSPYLKGQVFSSSVNPHHPISTLDNNKITDRKQNRRTKQQRTETARVIHGLAEVQWSEREVLSSLLRCNQFGKRDRTKLYLMSLLDHQHEAARIRYEKDSVVQVTEELKDPLK
uniref:Uncharacterized protein n=1 Tax=Calidris pygmaea TaxID=425635 RepID=A0A8C3JYY4_9CHAR